MEHGPGIPTRGHKGNRERIDVAFLAPWCGGSCALESDGRASRGANRPPEAVAGAIERRAPAGVGSRPAERDPPAGSTGRDRHVVAEVVPRCIQGRTGSVAGG